MGDSPSAGAAPVEARLRLPYRLSAVKVARRWTSAHCEPALSVEGLQMLELLTSEVVANAVVPGAEPLTLTVRSRPGHVTVEVDDASPCAPVAKDVELEATGGRGVALVAMLAQAWGWEAVPPGKRVWFCMEESGPAA